MERDRPIFVFGCPRSGTTLLQLMLHAHPRIAIPPENRFVIPAYTGRRTFGDLREAANRRRLADFLVARRGSKFRDFHLDAEEVAAAIVAGPPTLGSALATVFRAYAQRFGKPRWGDKRPAYYQYLPILRALFPDAQYVSIVRDGRDCVASLERMTWWTRGTYAAVSAWTQAVDYAARAARQLPPGSLHQVRYEQLVSDPESELTALCDFLGEDYDDAMARPRRIARVAVPRRKKWHARTRKAVNDAAVGGWEEQLQPWQVELCEAVMGGRLRAHGYPVSGASRPAAEHLLRYARVNAGRRLAHSRFLLADRWHRLRDPYPLAVQPLVGSPDRAAS